MEKRRQCGLQVLAPLLNFGHTLYTSPAIISFILKCMIVSAEFITNRTPNEPITPSKSTS